jgi:hypothetical protein
MLNFAMTEFSEVGMHTPVQPRPGNPPIGAESAESERDTPGAGVCFMLSAGHPFWEELVRKVDLRATC